MLRHIVLWNLIEKEYEKQLEIKREIKRILEKTGKKDTSAFNVFFVGSITGGTGAGLFLHCAFLRFSGIIDKMKRGGSYETMDFGSFVGVVASLRLQRRQ